MLSCDGGVDGAQRLSRVIRPPPFAAFCLRCQSWGPGSAGPDVFASDHDIVPNQQIVVRRPDVLIVEGLNVLAPPRHVPMAPLVYRCLTFRLFHLC